MQAVGAMNYEFYIVFLFITLLNLFAYFKIKRINFHALFLFMSQSVLWLGFSNTATLIYIDETFNSGFNLLNNYFLGYSVFPLFHLLIISINLYFSIVSIFRIRQTNKNE